jgi:hypothetical protein
LFLQTNWGGGGKHLPDPTFEQLKNISKKFLNQAAKWNIKIVGINHVITFLSLQNGTLSGSMCETDQVKSYLDHLLNLVLFLYLCFHPDISKNVPNLVLFLLYQGVWGLQHTFKSALQPLVFKHFIYIRCYVTNVPYCYAYCFNQLSSL